MLFAPFAGEEVCRRIAAPAAPHGTPNMEPLHVLDGAAWLWHPQLAAREPGFVLFRLNVESVRAETVRLQVSADLCYTLALDGALIGRGPDTGDVTHWSFATYELELKPGAHRLEVLVWWADVPQAPEGRMTWRGAAICSCYAVDEVHFALVSELYSTVVDTYFELLDKRKRQHYGAAELAAQDSMRKGWLADQLFWDVLAKNFVPYEAWSAVNGPPVVKY